MRGSVSTLGDIAKQVEYHPDQSKNIKLGEHDGIIAVDGRFKPKEPKPVERKDNFYQQRAGKQKYGLARREIRR